MKSFGCAADTEERSTFAASHERTPPSIESGPMRTNPFILGLAAVVGAVVGAESEVRAGEKTLQFHLAARHGSGETGTATLFDGTDGLIVHLRMSEESLVQPAHIRKGTCAMLDPNPAFALAPITVGRSQTTIPNLTIAALSAEPYALDVDRSSTEPFSDVACADIIFSKP